MKPSPTVHIHIPPLHLSTIIDPTMPDSAPTTPDEVKKLTKKELVSLLKKQEVDEPFSDRSSKEDLCSLYIQHVLEKKKKPKEAKATSNTEPSPTSYGIGTKRARSPQASVATTQAPTNNTTPSSTTPPPPITDRIAYTEWLFATGRITAAERAALSEKQPVVAPPTQYICTKGLDQNNFLKLRVRACGDTGLSPSTELIEFLCTARDELTGALKQHYEALRLVYPEFYKFVVTSEASTLRMVDFKTVPHPSFRVPYREFLGHCAALWYLNRYPSSSKEISGVAYSFYCLWEDFLDEAKDTHKSAH